MDLLLEVAIGLEVGVSILAFVFYYLPLSFRYSKIRLQLPEEVLDLKSTGFAFFSLHSPEVKQLIREVEKKSLPIEQSPKVPEFTFKIGSPFEFDDNSPGPGVHRLALSSGDHLPLWTENERPIRVDIEGDKIVYWFKYDGLRRIR